MRDAASSWRMVAVEECALPTQAMQATRTAGRVGPSCRARLPILRQMHRAAVPSQPGDPCKRPDTVGTAR